MSKCGALVRPEVVVESPEKNRDREQYELGTNSVSRMANEAKINMKILEINPIRQPTKTRNLSVRKNATCAAVLSRNKSFGLNLKLKGCFLRAATVVLQGRNCCITSVS